MYTFVTVSIMEVSQSNLTSACSCGEERPYCFDFSYSRLKVVLRACGGVRSLAFVSERMISSSIRLIHVKNKN